MQARDLERILGTILQLDPSASVQADHDQIWFGGKRTDSREAYAALPPVIREHLEGLGAFWDETISRWSAYC